MISEVVILNSEEMGHPILYRVGVIMNGDKVQRIKSIKLFKKDGSSEVIIFFDEGKKVIYHDVPFVTYHEPTEYKEEAADAAE